MSANSKGTFTYANVTSETTGCFSTSSSGRIKTVGDYYRSIATVSMNIAHTHSFSWSGNTSSVSGTSGSTTSTFTGTAGNTSSVGSGTSFSILPPYIVKYCWQRTA